MGWLPWAAKDERFFDLFEEHASISVACARELVQLLAGVVPIEKGVARIHDLENEADLVTHRCVEVLHRAFTTELPRDDIHRLISRLDDVVDFVDAAAERIHLYDLSEMTGDVRALADVVLRATETLVLALPRLRRLENPEALLQHCVTVNTLENEADQLLRSGVARLLKEEDPMLIIKWKEIYELLETATDHCEDVANVLEGIVLENG